MEATSRCARGRRRSAGGPLGLTLALAFPNAALAALQAAPCGLPSTSQSFAGRTGPIADFATQDFTCVVSGMDSVLWDLDLRVAIVHSYAADLDLTLNSPAGTSVTVTTDNGGGNDDVFGGTLFDDAVLDPVTDHVFTNLVTVPQLAPEGCFEAFRGEDPNGTWTLRIVDDFSGDSGALNAFSLDVVSIPALPPSTTTSFFAAPALAILDNTTQTSLLVVSGVGSELIELDVVVSIAHTYAADLDLALRSPAGTQVVLSTDNGGPTVDVFRGTSFDAGVTGAASDHFYASFVVATPLAPEGACEPFYGSDPNGTWELVVTDDGAGDTGLLEHWSLVLRTCGAPPCTSSITNYCTASTTTLGCTPTLACSASSASIAAGPGSFLIHCDGLEGQRAGLIFYGVNGRNAAPWGPTGILCVKSPIQRMRTQQSGGTSGQCDGKLTEDFFGYVLQANPFALGNPPSAGRTYDAQAWFRDPPAPKTTLLSDALEWTLCP